MADPSPSLPEDHGFRIVWPPPIRGFELDERHRKGGYAEIYPAAQKCMDGRRVCCKLLLPKHLINAYSAAIASVATGVANAANEAVERQTRRFVEEARITAWLQSRYVPHVYRRGFAKVTICNADGARKVMPWPYFIMEWIDGPRLEDFLTRPQGPWAIGTGSTEDSRQRFDQLSAEWQKLLLAVFAEIARGLQDAHQQGVVHLDVTPRNILMKFGKEVKLIDWGLARRLDSAGPDHGTTAPTGTGSPDYMAPEQVTGPGEAIGFPADVYALGSIGCLLLTGEPPRRSTAGEREARNREMLDQALCPLHHALLYQRIRESGAPPFWVALLTKCLSQRPEDRYRDASEVVAAIGEYEVAQEREKREQERRIHQAELQKKEAEKRAVRSRGIAVAVGLVAILLMSVISGIFWVTDLRNKNDLAVKQAEAEAREKRQAMLEAQRFALHRSLTGAYARWYKGDRARAKTDALKTLNEISSLADATPDDNQCLLLLAYANATVGEMLAMTYATNFLSPEKLQTIAAILSGRPPEGDTRRTLEEALAYYDRAVAIFEDLRGKWTDEPEDVRDGLATCYGSRGHLLGSLYRFTEALMAYDQSIALDTDPLRRSSFSNLRNLSLMKAAEWEQSKLPWSRPPHPEHAKAVRCAAYLADAKGASLAAIYNSACAHALAAKDDTATAEEQERRAAQAVRYLERIAKEGYFRNAAKLRELRTDEDLKALRDRPDFLELCRRAGLAN